MDNVRGNINFDMESVSDSSEHKELDMWENCDLNSRLKIPKGELHDHAIKHMLMCEVTLVDVSLLIFSFDFLKRKEIAFECYEKTKEISFKLLLGLEDRFVNAIVSYRLGYLYGNGHAEGGKKQKSLSDQFYKNAYDILILDVDNLNSLELFYLGAIFKDGKGVPSDTIEAVKYYTKSSDLGFCKALINIGCLYRDGDGVPKDFEKAVGYYKKAADLAYPPGYCHLAYMFEFGFGTKKDTTFSHELYILSARLGEDYSIDRCKALQIQWKTVEMMLEEEAKLKEEAEKASKIEEVMKMCSEDTDGKESKVNNNKDSKDHSPNEKKKKKERKDDDDNDDKSEKKIWKVKFGKDKNEKKERKDRNNNNEDEPKEKKLKSNDKEEKKEKKDKRDKKDKKDRGDDETKI